jgi:L-aspartate oxidase
VLRDAAGLQSLIGVIGDLEQTSGPALPLVTARLVAEAALGRAESRGGHFRSDFPQTAATAASTRLTLSPPPRLLPAAA